MGKRNNKWLYGWKLYVNYGAGWEYEQFEPERKGYLVNKKAYQEDCPYPQKWARGREPNPEFIKREVEAMLPGYKVKWAKVKRRSAEARR